MLWLVCYTKPIQSAVLLFFGNSGCRISEWEFDEIFMSARQFKLFSGLLIPHSEPNWRIDLFGEGPSEEILIVS